MSPAKIVKMVNETVKATRGESSIRTCRDEDVPAYVKASEGMEGVDIIPRTKVGDKFVSGIGGGSDEGMRTVSEGVAQVEIICPLNKRAEFYKRFDKALEENQNLAGSQL
jgi:hypothetical protein